jgi:cytochrome c-type biogenesis protein CcmH/NrfG
VIKESLIGMTLLAAATAWADDAPQPLDLKPGLWDISLTVKSTGLPPLSPEVLQKLTPAQRAQIDAQATKRETEGPRITRKRSCLQEKDLAQPQMFAFGSERLDCKQTVTSASRTRQEIHIDCGKGTVMGGGTVLIEVLDENNAKVTSEWSAMDGSRTIKMSSTAKLKWLGADCSAPVKEAPAKEAPAKAAAPAKVAAPADANRDPGYYYQLGKEQTAQGKLWEALRTLNKAIELDPKRAAYYNARGYAYLRLRNFANAIVEFSEAIRLQPDYANAFRNRAVALRHMGDAKGADADESKAAQFEKRH